MLEFGDHAGQLSSWPVRGSGRDRTTPDRSGRCRPPGSTVGLGPHVLQRHQIGEDRDPDGWPGVDEEDLGPLRPDGEVDPDGVGQQPPTTVRRPGRRGHSRCAPIPEGTPMTRPPAGRIATTGLSWRTRAPPRRAATRRLAPFGGRRRSRPGARRRTREVAQGADGHISCAACRGPTRSTSIPTALVHGHVGPQRTEFLRSHPDEVPGPR
jgi:hypothetical protein